MIVLWILLVVIHAVGCVLVVVGGLLLPFSGVPWPVWLTLGTLLVQMSFDRDTKCVLTDLENKLRKRMGWPEIPGFIEHYLGRVWG
jgi:hypothetical protein